MTRWAIFLLCACGLVSGVGIHSSAPTAASGSANAAAPHTPALAGTWQVLGAAHGLPTLYQPAGLAVDSNGNVYVADSGNFRVVEIGPRGQLIAHFGDADLRPAVGAPTPPSGQEQIGPNSLSVDARAFVYVADSIHRVIRVYSPQHRLVHSWPISVPGATGMQLAVAVGRRGDVFVAIAPQSRCTLPYGNLPYGPHYCAPSYLVQRRSSTGTLLGQFHVAIRSFGVGDPIITHIAVAVDGRGDTYVAPSGTDACYKDCRTFRFLIKHGPGGRVLGHWGTDELDISAGWPALAVGGRGNVFLADDYNHRIDKRASGGAVMAHWPLGSIFPTSPTCAGTPYASGCVEPSGITVDRKGNVYASDPGSNRILKLSPNGRLLAQWGAGGSQAGRFWFPAGLTLDTQGRLWVDDATNGRVQMLGTDGRFHVRFAVPHAGPSMAIDRQDNIYIGQQVGKGIFISKFSAAGTPLARWGPRWGDLNLAELPYGLAVAPSGDVFVVGFVFVHPPTYSPVNGVDILHLSPSGLRLGLIHISDSNNPFGIAVDGQGNSYTAYGTPPHFEKHSQTGALLASWGFPKPAFSSPSPRAIALDAAGNIYVANTPQNRVEELRPDGTLLHTWGGPGSYAGQFHSPSGIAVDSKGTIYVADSDNHRIEKLSR